MTARSPRHKRPLALDILALQVEHAYRQLGTALVVNLVNGLVLALIVFDDIDISRLLAWLAALYTVTFARYILLRRFRSPAARATLSDSDWGLRFVMGTLAAGLVWGAAGVLLFHSSLVTHQIFLAFVLGGMIAGALPLLSAIPLAFPLYAVAVSLPITVRLLAEGHGIARTMALLFMVFIVAMVLSSRQFTQVLRDSIELRLKLMSSIEEKQHEALLARIDSLTAIPNRRLFEEALASEWKRAQRAETSLAMLIADIDFFKLYNDRLGHPAGDGCLRQVAESLATAARRPGDLVARIGGEEFAFILPNTSRRDAAVIAERVREDVLALEIPHPASPISDFVTISLGVADIRPEDGKTSRDLVQAADAALYAAKKQGRNRVLVAGESGEETAT